MERKVKMDMNEKIIVGIVFSILGLVFTPIGILVCVPIALADKDLWVAFFVATGMGGLSLWVGITFLVLEIKKYKMQKRILAEGYYIYAEVLEINRNLAVQINNHGHPYVIKCGYTDENGTLHIFKSRNITRYPGNNLIGQQVRVYLDRNDYNNFKNYYMDIDEILPNVVEH